MCGIVGVAGPARSISRELLVEMRDTLGHRGPDDSGTWWSPDEAVGLGHRRLSVIDLSAAARQPMSDAAGTVWIVFNGEIYNYRELRSELRDEGVQFRTSSDTEVILAAYARWGISCLSRLNGMFALAVCDQRSKQVILARDRAGEKPLFYRIAGHRLTFASELKALLVDSDCPRVVDRSALEEYLAFGYVIGARSILKDVHKLPAAHCLTFDLETAAHAIHRYWSLPDAQPLSNRHEDLVDQVDALLADSVRLRLIADVPVGILLSGGLDSSLIAAAAARVSPARVKTFTITFPGHRQFDEAPHARLVAGHLGTEHIELAAEPATVDLLPALARQVDEPMADSSIVPTYLVSKLIRREATVALGGDGGDELFGGYPHYNWIQQQSFGASVPAPLQRLVEKSATALLPVGIKGRNYVLALAAGDRRRLAVFNQYFDAAARANLLRSIGPPAEDPELSKLRTLPRSGSPLRLATMMDFTSYLVDDILVKVDRASMLASLEVRAPWLDPRLIEFAFGSLPDEERATATARKVLLRSLARRHLPPAFDARRKQGFSLPLNAWFKGAWGKYCEEVLLAPQQIVFDHAAIRKLFDGQRRGRSNTQRLFALMMFELWRREYRIATVS